MTKDELERQRLNARGKQILQRQKAGAVRPHREDGYVNLLNKYGTSQDNSEAYQFEREPIIPDTQLTGLYEGNGLFSKIIDTPAEEALKHGFSMADKEPLEILEKISDMYDYAHDALKQFPRDERYALVSDIKHKIDVLIDLCIKAKRGHYKKTTLREMDDALDTLRFYVKKSYKFRYLSEKKFFIWNDYLTQIGKMLGKWITNNNQREMNMSQKEQAKNPK